MEILHINEIGETEIVVTNAVGAIFMEILHINEIGETEIVVTNAVGAFIQSLALFCKYLLML